MEVGDIRVNQEVELDIKSGIYRGQYQTKISDINENSIKVMTPYYRGSLLPLRKNDIVDVFFKDESAAYKYSARVLGRTLKPVPQLIITCPDSFKRIQRRDFFRLEVKENVVYCKIDEEGLPLTEEKKTITRDLSGGGVRIVIDEKMKSAVLLKLNIDIPVIKNVPIFGRIVNIYETSSAVEAAIEFVDIKPQIRDKIVGWLFDKQREWRRKGLL